MLRVILRPGSPSQSTHLHSISDFIRSDTLQDKKFLEVIKLRLPFTGEVFSMGLDAVKDSLEAVDVTGELLSKY